jgi:hypothetical protein
MRKDSHLAGTLPTLCESLPIKDLAPAAHVACEHGIGHGLAALYTLDIKRSFNGCTTLSGYDAQFNCGRGVLMEVIDSPVLEHPRMTFPDDIVAFCRSFTGVLSRACFANAGSRELARSGDAIKAIANCNASPDNRDTCLSYLGQNAYFLLGKDVDRTLAVCQQAEAGLGACVTGVLESVVYVKDANHGMAVCESLSPDDLHECYGKLGELTEFNYGSSERQDSCAKLGSSAVGACMDGSERN